MKGGRVHFSRVTDEWATPAAVYDGLHAEFGFVDDPCPMGQPPEGLMREWKSPCFVNPPYSDMRRWMNKAALEAAQGKTIVMLVPSRTSTRWWHDYAMQAAEIRFIRGRLKFGGAKHNAPFDSCVLVFRRLP